MKTLNEPKSDTTDHIPQSRQDGVKTPQAKSRAVIAGAIGTVGYWEKHVYRNTYRDRQGIKRTVPEYYCRMRHAGQTKVVRLRHGEKEKAAREALDLFLRLQTEGWVVITNRLAHLPASSTIEDLIGAYTKATASMERVPRPITVHLYTRCLKQLCAVAGVTQIRDLTPEVVEKFKGIYRAKARARKRPEDSMNNTLATIIRNAAACFSREARAIMERNGLSVANPFEGISTKVTIQPVSPLPREIVARIWAEAPLLRDGDPDEADPNLKQYVKRYKRTHEGRQPGRWVPIDWRKPHPDAYAALLLALGCGLRANEVDKARWSWLKLDADGNCYVEVKAESDFTPKGGMNRTIKIPRELYDAITATREDLASPYVLGGPVSTESSQKGGGFYRRMDTIRTINTWLRDRGVEADMKYGKPLHRLRKQFGSELATAFGLFAAQKLLGHSTPTITARHYAAQTNLPDLKHVRIVG